MTDRIKMLEQFLERVKDDIAKEAINALQEAYSDMLPYISEDTEMNAAYQASDLVRNIIAGRFEWDESGEYINIQSVREYSPSVRIAFTSFEYDSLRDKIIERMSKCPKDAKIEMLERKLKECRKW
jgi:hypothetical protein